MNRIRVQSGESIFEVEGSEEFVRDLYEDFKQQSPVQATGTKDTGNHSNRVSKSNNGSKRTKKSKRKDSFSIVKDVNLIPQNEVSLSDFYKIKSPSSGMEKTAVFVFYLKNFARVDKVTIDHVYTCYRAVGIPVPGALRQNLLDTSSKKGYIDTSNFSDISMTVIGDNLIEHNLPKKNMEN